MRKILMLFPILILMFSCENKDLVILKSQKNCSCSDIINEALQKEQDNVMRKFRENDNYDYYSDPLRGAGRVLDVDLGILIDNCDPPFDYYEQTLNEEVFSQTKTLVLKNNSETKVYEVLMQINENDKIRYEKYNIQPTEVIELGCANKFKISFNYTNENSNPFKALKLSNLSNVKILYKIHKIKIISEY